MSCTKVRATYSCSVAMGGDYCSKRDVALFHCPASFYMSFVTLSLFDEIKGFVQDQRMPSTPCLLIRASYL